MLRSLCLAAALSACAPTFALTSQRKPPVWLYAVDVAVMSAGACAGLDGWSRHDVEQERVGFGIAAAFWGAYWLPIEGL